MASLVNRPNGHKWLQFTTSKSRKRYTLRLGKVSEKVAMDFKFHLESLIASQSGGLQLSGHTIAWLNSMSDRYHRNLVTAGLVADRRNSVSTLSVLLSRYEAGIAAAKSTIDNVRQMHNSLIEYFGADRDIATINTSDANDFKAHLLLHGNKKGGPLAAATVSRRIRRCRAVFKFAVDNGWLQKSPFSHMKGFCEVNKKREHFVAVDKVNAIFPHISDHEIRAAVALARWGGLRFPSEILPLEWESILWERNLIHVWAQKTVRHENGQDRYVPLFPEIKECLLAIPQSCRGQFVFPTRRKCSAMSTTNALERACRAANVALWQRPWNNMRSTRVTELLKTYPIHEVGAWMGHSPETLLKHYAQIAKEPSEEMICAPSVLRFSDGEKAG